eukprot:NODE_9649_length_1408_cov_7.704137.p1 GENE.NODE_9649_length_1408_cov_7.704137~~NODE_9649_length_1408_cov_7.704137.p1  ORF type:complete len:437 (+),score=126.09 NODE_9649_length_1408_cov_7.704137:109-1311(+)
MGIYETLYAFQEAFGTYMGEPGTHPWSQGFPLTTQIPGGPPMPKTAELDSALLQYPKAFGYPPLREAVADYYRTNYGANIDAGNVMIFAGGRPALVTALLFLEDDVGVRIASTEYTPYYDMLVRLGKPYALVESSEENRFRPDPTDYFDGPAGGDRPRTLALLSNPCNPTGVTLAGDALKELVRQASMASEGRGMIIDEAYDMFHNAPVSSLAYIEDINNTNIIVTGACTKGLQSPGIRIGWAISSHRNIETLGNYSSFGMGGVSHLSQLFALQLFEKERMKLSCSAIPTFYAAQRDRYGAALREMGIELFTGDGGFYHWCKLPGGITAQELNERLFKDGAAILRGTDCDMTRAGLETSTLRNFFRFSFGPLPPESFEEDVHILKNAINDLLASKSVPSS